MVRPFSVLSCSAFRSTYVLLDHRTHNKFLSMVRNHQGLLVNLFDIIISLESDAKSMYEPTWTGSEVLMTDPICLVVSPTGPIDNTRALPGLTRAWGPTCNFQDHQCIYTQSANRI